MEGFVFDLQRFATIVGTVYSSNISYHNEGYLIISDSSGTCEYQNNYTSDCIARILSNREILVNKNTQIIFKFNAGDGNTYTIKSTEDGIDNNYYTLRGSVEIKGTGANPYSGSGLTISYTGTNGSNPSVTGFDPVYYNAFTLRDMYNNRQVNYSVQTSYDSSTFVAAKSSFGSPNFIVGASSSATADAGYGLSFTHASLSLVDVLRAATSVGYNGNIGIEAYDYTTDKTIWSSNGAAGVGALQLTTNAFFLYNTGGQVTISVGAGTIGDVTIQNASATLDASNAGAKTGTIAMASGAKVKDANSGVWTAGANGSTSSVNNGVMTLKTGAFTGSSSTSTANIDAGAQMKVDHVTFSNGAVGTFTNNSNADTLTVTAGTASIDTNSTVTTVTANGVAYTVGNGTTVATFAGGSKSVTSFNAGTISFTAADNTSYAIGNQTIADGNGKTVAFISKGSDASYLYSTSGAITLTENKSMAVSSSDGSKTSTIAAGSGSSIDVTVTNGTYVISGLDDGKTVTLDGVEYAYNAATQRLLKDGMGWQLATDGTIGFTIADGTDTILDTYGTAIAPKLTTDLADILNGLNSAGTLYFNAAGMQQTSTTGEAYTLTRDSSGNYTLTSNTNSTENLTINLTEVAAAKLEKLTINLAEGTTGAQKVKLKAGAGLAGLTLGAGDSVLDSSDNTLAKAGTASGTVTVANGTVTALTKGTFVGVGTTVYNIAVAVESTVTVDGVTFAAGAAGTFTNDETDTFEVTSGTATVDAAFSGTATAAGVAYTVAAGTVATFSADTPKNVTGFTAGKITLTAANETTYNIGNQTIKDGNGATLTFVPTGLCSTGEGNISLGAGDSITVSNESGTNTKQIAAGDGSTIDVAVTNGKYTLSGLDNGEKVTIGDKTYLYHGNTGFLEEMSGSEGTGRGYRLKTSGNNATIAFTTAGVLDTDTAIALPDTMAGDAGQFAAVCSVLEEGQTFKLKADGSRALESDTVAYELTKTANGYTLTSKDGATENITLDTSGLTGLTVDLTAGSGQQTLKVNDTTTLSSDSKLGAGDKITDGTNTLLTANAATTLSVAAGQDISVASGANVTVPATPGIKTAGNGNYTVNGISVTTSGDSASFISIKPDAETANTLTFENLAEGETFTANTAGKNYTVGGQTFQNVSAGVTINGAGTATLTGTQSVTVGTNNTVIQPISGNGVQVTLTDGKYTLSGLDNGEKVSIGGKTYLYRKETQFLEEYNNSYPEGSGDGYILTNDGSITLNSDGTPADNTARTMPASLAEDGALEIICKAVPEGTTQKYSFDKDGKRANPPESAAYTLEKKDDGSYVLVSTDSCTGELPIDARGLTDLTVDFSKGTGKQTLNVNEKTELVDGSKLGTGDVIKYDSGTYVTCGTGTTSVFLTPEQPMTIGSMTPGTTVSVAPGKSVNVDDSVYKAADTGVTIGAADDGTIGVKSGTLSATSGTYIMLTSDGKTVGDTVEVSGDTEVEIAPDENGKATIKGLDEVGEEVVIKDSSGGTSTYEVFSQGIVKKVDSTGKVTYMKVTGESVFKEDGDTGVITIEGAPVSPEAAGDGTTSYNADGKILPSDSEGEKAAILTKNGNSSTLEVRKDMVLGVQLDDGTVTVKDKGTDTTYTVNGTEIGARGATFTSAGGVVSDVTGTLTVKKGALDTKDGSADARYTLNDGTKVNFQEGSPLSGTSVTTAEGVIIIRESDNKTATTVDSHGNITGIDGDAEITGLPGGATVTTTGSGILSLNGKTWKVEGDSDGASFTVDKESSGKLSSVSGLNEGAVISTEDSMTGMTLNGCTLTRAPEGFSYTEGRTQGQGTFSFTHTGDAITLADGTTSCKVNQNQDGVSIGTDGKLTGLSDGEKVTITKGTDTYTYEVSGGTLVTTKVSAGGAVTTMTSILPAGETAFSIEAGQMKAANGSTAASQLKENTDINAGSTEVSPVNTVTNGMLLDKKGHATADRDKAIAEITIKDDGALKYEATQEVRQTIQIGENSTAEWEITTTDKADTIDYAGSHDVSITSRDGNDKITISGTGDAVVRGISGKNTITHTGSGDATLQGGTGNDTITSTHAEDTITGGDGKDTFILTNVESHVTDFTYGQDKAVVTSSAGALAPHKVKVTTDGNISYTGAGAVSGSLNVDGQGYGDFYAATLADVDGHNKLNVGWTGAQGGMIDASALTDKVLLLGNSNGVSDSLIGGQSIDTLVAGNGASSLWGGAGSDLIESNDEASHTIFFLEGDGNDTVTGFTPYGDSSSDNPDTLDFLGQGLTAVKNTSQGLQLYHGSDKMTLIGNYDANTMIQWENGNDHGIAKIGKTGEDNKFTYNEEVTNYLGSSGKDTITIGDDVDKAEIWLDGSHGKSYDSVEILDAGSTNGKAILAGGAGANTIISGKGNSSLWGGSDGANDLLKGGTGEDVFYYGKDEGNDIINNASTDDKVMLYNLSLSDLKGATIDTSQITITQQNGQTLTINGRAGEFTLSDGSTWAADYSTKTWSRVK